MDDDPSTATGSSIANRDEPIPVIRIPSREDVYSSASADSGSEAGSEAPRQGTRQRPRMKETKSRDKWESLQDRVFSNLMAQIVGSAAPATGDEERGESEEEQEGGEKKKDGRSSAYVERPDFGPRLMAFNFRRFNARIGVVFVVQNRLIHLFAWRRPAATLSFLAIYTLVCLEPQLLPLLPLAAVLLGVMIPSFLARHPTPANDPRIEPSFRGPPTAPASRVKPAPDLSVDFWRNMRDLQNSMEDFSRLHDAANAYVTPYTNFSDEALSSSLFLGTCALGAAMVAGSAFIPWKWIALAAGWALTLAGHPRAQRTLLAPRTTRALRRRAEHAHTALRNFVAADVVLDEPPDVRQVEIFELQKHHLYSDTWEHWLFAPTPHEPLCAARVAGGAAAARPRGAQFFDDVQPPAGWAWKEKKWSLDLLSREWVEQRMISAVEIETEGERWVYDIPPDRVDDPSLRASLEDEWTTSSSSPPKKKSKQQQKPLRSVPKSGWEEGNGLEARGGEWRRRRWTRLVERRRQQQQQQQPSSSSPEPRVA